MKPVILDALGRLRGAIAPALTFVALVLIWEGACRYYEVPTWLLPGPSEIAAAFRKFGGELWRNILVTLYETITGFILAIVVAIPLAVLIVASPFLRKTIYPILLALQSVPNVAVPPCWLSGSVSGRCPRSWSCS